MRSRAPIELEEGATAKAGALALKVTRTELRPVGDPHIKEKDRYVHVEVVGVDPDAVYRFKLLDAAGKVLSEDRGRSMRRHNEHSAVTYTLVVRPEVRAGVLEIEYFKDAKEVFARCVAGAVGKLNHCSSEMAHHPSNRKKAIRNGETPHPGCK